MVAPNEHKTQITVGDETVDLWGYKTNKVKMALVWVATILTFGAFRLLLHWYPKLLVKFTATRCHLSVADCVLVQDLHMNVAFRPVKCMVSHAELQIAIPSSNFQVFDVSRMRYFTYKKVLHAWHPNEMKFLSVEEFDCDIQFSCFHELVEKGLTNMDVTKRLVFYGKNLIDVNLKPIIVLLFKEVISPFYIFQIFSVSVWFTDEYEIYAAVIIVMSLASITMDVYQIRKQEKKLRSMVHSSDLVDVVRNGGQVEKIESIGLVPGDVILIPPDGCVIQCDAVLMNGTAIVNESMLTGESVPVTKVALPDIDDESHVYKPKEHSRHTLFCGTQVLQTRYYSGKSVKAVVLRTAFTTLKGQLVRSIMYPKPVDFRFTKDLFKFVGFLSCIAACGFAYTIGIMIIRGSSVRKVILRALDIITIVVPPALPAAMSIGVIAAQMRLRKKQVFCISPSTINTCGAINVVCFDKTGTLTEDGLNFHSVRPVTQHSNDRSPTFDRETTRLQTSEMAMHVKLVEAISTCHSLTRIHGKLCGDPLDLILFNNTGCLLDEFLNSGIAETDRFDVLQPTVVRIPTYNYGGSEDTELAILRQFTFSSSLQRMSVIVHNPKDNSHDMTIFCKGAPEKIASLCIPSTIPSNYHNIVNDYAQHGYRLIAVAYRKCQMNFAKSQKINRDAVECDLILLGLVIMENRLKVQTVGVIHQLNKAMIRTIMVTGDNILTALSVARECGIIQPTKKAFIVEVDTEKSVPDGCRTPLVIKQSASSSEDLLDDSSSAVDVESNFFIEPSYQLAVSGPVFEVLCSEYPELVHKFVTVCDVFARMSPEQKQFLVNKLQEVDYTVAMCGDGANDCGALKAAHAGISLSDAEASIAAPFTSRIADIRCVLLIIREGRAALVTSFGVFKYMAGYSLTQFITILQLYWLGANLTDFQFLYIDLCLVALVALFFGNTTACEKISSKSPPIKLLSVGSMLSVLGQLLIAFIFQITIFIYTSLQPWFIPYTSSKTIASDDKRSMQGTAIFCLSTFQYIALAVIYSKGYPYRKTIFSNKPLCVVLCLLAVASAFITVCPPAFMVSYMQFDPIPEFGYRIFIVVMALISAVIADLYEMVIIDRCVLSLRSKWRRKRAPVKSSSIYRFEKYLISIGSNPSWIPVISYGQSNGIVSPTSDAHADSDCVAIRS